MGRELVPVWVTMAVVSVVLVFVIALLAYDVTEDQNESEQLDEIIKNQEDREDELSKLAKRIKSNITDLTNEEKTKIAFDLYNTGRTVTSEFSLCSVCKTLMKKLENIIHSSDAIGQIVYALSKQCDTLDWAKYPCHLLIKTTGIAISKLIQKYPPSSVCNNTRVCY